TSARQARGRANVRRRYASAPVAARAAASTGAAPLLPACEFGLPAALAVAAAVLAFAFVSVARRARGARAGRRLAHLERPGEIRPGQSRDPFPERLAQRPRLDLHDRAGRELAELERTEGDADQPVDLEAEVAEHVLDLAVLALADGETEPDIAALGALERRLDRTKADAGNGDAGGEPSECLRRDAAMRAHAVAAQPGGRRQLEHARERAVIGEQQQALGVDVEPADADEARQGLGQGAENGRPAARIRVAGQEAARLVVEEEPRALAAGQRPAVDGDAIRGGDVARRRGDDLAVDGDASGRNPALGFAARAQPGPRN